MSNPFEFSKSEVNPNFPDVKDVPPEELKTEQSKVKMIDVRRPDEYIGELGHIEGAELLVLDTLPQRISELPKEETIVFVCRSGNRSAQAANFAAENGFKHVYNLKGGMILWNELGLPITQEE